MQSADTLNGIDVFVTVYQEDPALVERCVRAAQALHGAHATWLLDDGSDPRLARLAAEIGVGYLTRPDRRHAKAGNVNHALACTEGEIVVIFDVDHVPQPDFLERTVAHFADPAVGFIQVMLTFSNQHESWVARAAVESAKDYYNAASLGADSLAGVTLTGSNALLRRSALATIGGYQPGLAEDLATSIALHAAGWQSVYVHEPLAPGLAPATLTAWFTQQLKWSRGVFELLLTEYPRLFLCLTPGQRISYGVRMTYYWIGLVVALHLVVVTALLYFGGTTPFRVTEGYFVRLYLLAAITLIMRMVVLRDLHHHDDETGPQWRAVALVFSTWPIYTLAWFMALFRMPLAFRPTPKSSDGRLPPLWMAPQLATVGLLCTGVALAAGRVPLQYYPMTLIFIVAAVVLQIWMIVIWLLEFGQPAPRPKLPVQPCPSDAWRDGPLGRD